MLEQAAEDQGTDCAAETEGAGSPMSLADFGRGDPSARLGEGSWGQGEGCAPRLTEFKSPAHKNCLTSPLGPLVCNSGAAQMLSEGDLVKLSEAQRGGSGAWEKGNLVPVFRALPVGATEDEVQCSMVDAGPWLAQAGRGHSMGRPAHPGTLGGFTVTEAPRGSVLARKDMKHLSPVGNSRQGEEPQALGSSWSFVI